FAQVSFGSAAETARAAAKPMMLISRIVLFIVVAPFCWCMVGAVIRAFTKDNVGEKAGMHYPCFGQRRAFFASIDVKYPMETAKQNHPEEPKAPVGIKAVSLVHRPGGRFFLKRTPAATVYFGRYAPGR